MITVRPWNVSDWPLVYLWSETCWQQNCDDFTPTDVSQFIAQRQNAVGAEYFAVWRNEELIGIMTGVNINPVCIQGHLTLKRSVRGMGYAFPAIRIARDLAWARGYRKLWFLIYEDNSAMLRVLKKLGAIDEGTLFAHTMREGRPVNVKSLCILKPGG